MPAYAGPPWDGLHLPGRRVLLWCEEGRGDTIMFIRYARCVALRGQEVVVHCPPEQVRLLSTACGVSKASDDIDALGQYDCHAPLMSLPLLTWRPLPEDSPTTGPYLSALPAEVETCRERVRRGRPFVVGVCWSGNPANPCNPGRSAPARLFGTLRCRKVFISPWASESEVEAAGTDDCGARGWHDLAAAAAAFVHLDLVVTTDTAAAHLAGALGVPTWVLLARGDGCPCWRWGTSGDRTPYYPKTRLYRQPRRGDWDSVFAEVSRDLGQLGLVA